MSESKPKYTFNDVLGYIVSLLFSLVFSKYLSDYFILTAGLQSILKGYFASFISYFAVTALGLNLFRMLHGYVIAIHDPRISRILQTGPPPYSPFELLTMIVVLVIPILPIYFYPTLQKTLIPFFCLSMQCPN